MQSKFGSGSQLIYYHNTHVLLSVGLLRVLGADLFKVLLLVTGCGLGTVLSVQVITVGPDLASLGFMLLNAGLTGLEKSNVTVRMSIILDHQRQEVLHV